MADKREFLFSFLGKENVSKTAAKAGAGIEDLGDKMSETGRDAKKLDQQIGDVEKSLKDLAGQYSRTGDDTFVKQIREQERELRKLKKVRVHLGEIFDPAEVADVGVQVGARLGPIMIQSLSKAVGSAGPAIAVGAPIVAGIAAWLGTAGVGAVLGGAAAGAVAGGIAIAAKDSRVQAAGAELAAGIGAQLEDAAAPFVPATLKAIKTVGAGFRGLGSDLDDIFGRSAQYVQPLTDGIMGLVREAVPGFRDIVTAALPVVHMLSRELPELGDDIGDTLSGLAQHAPEAAQALGMVLDVAGAGIKMIGQSLEIASTAFKYADIFASGFKGPAELAGTIAGYQIAAEAAESGTDDWTESLANLGQKASTATYEVRSLSEAVDEIIGQNLSLAESTVAAEQAIDDATEAIKENGKNVDANTQKGRDNISALTDMAAAFNTETAAADKSGQSTGQASEMHKRHAAALYAAARAAGHTDGEAKKLVSTWLKVPKNVNTHVKSSGIPEVKGQIAGIKGKTITIAMRLTGYTNVSGTIAALKKNQRWGGIDYAMASGGAIEAHHATSPTVLYGERETGGEAFIPKHGNRQRSMQILEKAAGWYGASVTSGAPRYAMAAHPGMMAAPAAPPLVINAAGAGGLDRVFLGWLMKAIRDAGGNPAVLGL